MVESLKIEIGLDGASDIDQQLQIIRNGFASLGRVAVPVAAAITAALVATTKATIAFAESITAINEQATKMGQSIEQFDSMRQALEGAGTAAQNVTGFMQKLGAAADKAALGKVTQAAKELGDALSSGGFISGTSSLRTLVEAAKQIGPAGVAARKEMEKLGMPIPPDAKLSLDELIAKTGSAEEGLKAFVEQLRQMPAGAQTNRAALDALGVSATQLITAYDQLGAKGVGAITPDMVSKAEALTGAVNRLQAAWNRFGSVSFAPVITAQVNTVTAALQSLQAMIEGLSFQSVANGIFAVGNALGNLSVGEQILHGLEIIFPSIVQAVREAGTAIGEFAAKIASITWDAISNLGVMAWNALTGAIQSAINALLQFIGLAPSAQAPATGGGAPGHASGGLLGGRGTGTSDSNLAWVSRGEHIMPAHAVRQPGVLALLEALRRSGGNLSHVLNGMGRFALGGVVPGGLAGGSNVTIQFPGLPPISGLRASADVVDQLHKAAALAQVRSGGRKPSRYS